MLHRSNDVVVARDRIYVPIGVNINRTDFLKCIAETGYNVGFWS